LHRVATFNADHTRARIYNDDVRGDSWRKGDLHSLTMFPSDQILIARLLADRRGCYLHSAAEGQSLPRARYGGGGEWRVYGTWSHSDVQLVSANDAPLRAICFIEQANENTITPLTDRKEITRRLLACVIKPFVTADWWEKTLDLIGEIGNEAPCYVMRFDQSGEIAGEIKKFIDSRV
jgi:hypothetical protein